VNGGCCKEEERSGRSEYLIKTLEGEVVLVDGMEGC